MMMQYIIGFYDKTAVRELMKECSKMYKFDHPNVLTLKGVCLDGGPAPYIIMPFMANGSLVSYLHKKRELLIITHGDKDDEEVGDSTLVYNSYKNVHDTSNAWPLIVLVVYLVLHYDQPHLCLGHTHDHQ